MARNWIKGKYYCAQGHIHSNNSEVVDCNNIRRSEMQMKHKTEHDRIQTNAELEREKQRTLQSQNYSEAAKSARELQVSRKNARQNAITQKMEIAKIKAHAIIGREKQRTLQSTHFAEAAEAARDLQLARMNAGQPAITYGQTSTEAIAPLNALPWHGPSASNSSMSEERYRPPSSGVASRREPSVIISSNSSSRYSSYSHVTRYRQPKAGQFISINDRPWTGQPHSDQRYSQPSEYEMCSGQSIPYRRGYFGYSQPYEYEMCTGQSIPYRRGHFGYPHVADERFTYAEARPWSSYNRSYHYESYSERESESSYFDDDN